MRQIAHDFFAHSPVMMAPLVSMLLFIAVFVAVIVRLARTRNDEIESRARLALEEGAPESAAHPKGASDA